MTSKSLTCTSISDTTNLVKLVKSTSCCNCKKAANGSPPDLSFFASARVLQRASRCRRSSLKNQPCPSRPNARCSWTLDNVLFHSSVQRHPCLISERNSSHGSSGFEVSNLRTPCLQGCRPLPPPACNASLPFVHHQRCGVSDATAFLFLRVP